MGSLLFVELWGPETWKKIFKLVGLIFIDTPGEPLIRRIIMSGVVKENFHDGWIKFIDTLGEPLIRRIMRAGDVRENFHDGRIKFYIHARRA